MKKLILVLAILFAVPAFAALNISLVQQSPDGNKVDLKYAGANASNLPRAFGLNVVVDSPAKIKAVSGYKTNGMSTSASRGYGIYPNSIVIDGNTGSVPSWGTPVAPSTALGAANSGVGTHKVVLEFGSLYFDDSNAPATSGTLCTLTMDCNGATSDVTIAVTEEDTYRGGVVLEDGSVPSPNLTASLVYTCGGGWPDCWSYVSQCYGDSDDSGSVDIDDFFALYDAWQAAYGDDAYNPCADFTRDGYVDIDDFFALYDNWQTEPPTDCTPGGTWPPEI